MNNDQIEKIIDYIAAKGMSEESYNSFIKLNLASKILGLKIFAHLSRDFETLYNLEKMEMQIT